MPIKIPVLLKLPFLLNLISAFLLVIFFPLLSNYDTLLTILRNPGTRFQLYPPLVIWVARLIQGVWSTFLRLPSLSCLKTPAWGAPISPPWQMACDLAFYDHFWLNIFQVSIERWFHYYCCIIIMSIYVIIFYWWFTYFYFWPPHLQFSNLVVQFLIAEPFDHSQGDGPRC